jgi:hypothetical protein
MSVNSLHIVDEPYLTLTFCQSFKVAVEGKVHTADPPSLFSPDRTLTIEFSCLDSSTAMDRFNYLIGSQFCAE